ncbi:MAG TPA: sigma-70 family RNA polymerase sigma factor [Trueperaceae bacterium]|nr:sigma-70 family RNA polymerase sigma factor [Trueperaceae bacterium]
MELVARVAARDEAALIELHQRYAPYLAAVARRMLKDPDEVQQCVQDAFVNLWNHAGRFDDAKASCKTWLVTICHRLAINRIRGTKLQTMPLAEWDAPDRQPDHVERVVMRDAVDGLEEEERELIELAFYQGMSHSEVATLTGRPLGTVKTKIRGALTRLRATLTGEPE